MPGRERRIILQERDQRLLSALDSYRVVDREQAMRLAPFSSVSRANARLLRLVQAGFLRRSFIGPTGAGRKAIYRPGRLRASFSEKLLRHQLALNAVRLAFEAEGRLLSWRSFSTPLSHVSSLVPDGYVEIADQRGVIPVFIETDCGTEPGSVVRRKAEHYLRFASSGEFERLFGREQFRVALITTSERRAQNLASAILAVTPKLFFITTLPRINSDGPYASVWLRPDGRAGQPLL